MPSNVSHTRRPAVRRGNLDLRAIPVRRPAQALGNDVRPVVLAVQRLGIHAVVDERREHGAGHGRAIPGARRGRRGLCPGRRVQRPCAAVRSGIGRRIRARRRRRDIRMWHVDLRREADAGDAVRRGVDAGLVLHQPAAGEGDGSRQGIRQKASRLVRRREGEPQRPHREESRAPGGHPVGILRSTQNCEARTSNFGAQAACGHSAVPSSGFQVLS